MGSPLMRAGSLEFIACCLQAAHSDALSHIQMARQGLSLGRELVLTIYIQLRKEGPSDSGQFQGLPGSL